MTYREALRIAIESERSHVGIRFENKERTIGETINEASKRLVDERDFPEYNTKEYDSLEDMEGVSSFSLINNYEDDIEWCEDLDAEINSGNISAKYAYIIVSDGNFADESCDEGEAVYDRPEVIQVIKL
jgi:hypothetical protein